MEVAPVTVIKYRTFQKLIKDDAIIQLAFTIALPRRVRHPLGELQFWDICCLGDRMGKEKISFVLQNMSCISSCPIAQSKSYDVTLFTFFW